MKVLIFSLSYYPRFVAGAEVAIKEITDRISLTEIEFDMITRNAGGEASFEKIGNVNVYRILGIFGRIGFIQKFLFPFFAFTKGLSLHAKRNYDAIWSMMASYAGFAGSMFKRARPNVEFILTLQEGERFGIREGLLKPIFKWIFLKADKIQVISTFLADWAWSMGARCQITVIPNAVDFDFFSKRKQYHELEILKQRLGKKMDDIFLITTGRLAPKNATVNVIDSLKYLPENVKFLIIGSGREEKMLKERTAKLGLSRRVNFLGFIGHKDLPQYLHISDIFIRPSLSEGFGNSYIEAMAADVPVIATRVGGILDFVRDGETGLFCEVKNPKSIAQKVEKLIKDKESRDYIVKNAKAMVQEKYDWNIIANNMKNEVFLRVI